MPVSAMHDDDLIYFDLIQVTKPSTRTHLKRSSARTGTSLHRGIPLSSAPFSPFAQTPPFFVGAFPRARPASTFAGLAEKGERASPHLVR
jgi:hypothetical protein